MNVSGEEQTKLHHSTLLEEYKCIKADIAHNVGMARQVVGLTITTGGILLAGTPFIVQNQLPTLYLVAPFLFYALAWIQLRCVHVEYHLVRYLTDVLVPQIRQVLAEDSKPEHAKRYQSIMSWEAYFERMDYQHSPLTLAIARGASNSYGITLFLALISILAYCVLAFETQSVLFLDWLLVAANIVVFLYTFGLGLRFRFFADRDRKTRVTS